MEKARGNYRTQIRALLESVLVSYVALQFCFIIFGKYRHL
jgi:hypothetical protein